MEEAITRLKLAAAAGADVCFIEGVRTKELLESTVAALAPTPVRIHHERQKSDHVNTSSYLGSCQCYLRWFDALVHISRGGTNGR